MRTQSRDTSPEMEQVQIAGLRAFAPAKKFASVRSISASMHFAALKSEVHSGSDYERTLAFLERCSPPTIVQAFRAAIPHPAEWVLSLFDVLPPLECVSSALDQAHVPFALAGSLACAIYGFPRGIRTIEFFVDLDPYQATALVQRIRCEQLVPTSGWSLKVEKSQPLGLLFLPSLVGVELRLPSKFPFDRVVLTRPHRLELDQGLPDVPVLAPEACVLQGVVHYQATGACDDDLYNELLGVLKIQAPTLDQGALVTFASVLGAQEILTHLLEDAGIAGGHQAFATDAP